MALIDETISIEDGVVVTASDTADLEFGVCKGIWVGTAGNVQITTANGRVLVLTSMLAGMVHRVKARRIWSTNTTAVTIVALY